MYLPFIKGMLEINIVVIHRAVCIVKPSSNNWKAMLISVVKKFEARFSIRALLLAQKLANEGSCLHLISNLVTVSFNTEPKLAGKHDTKYKTERFMSELC